MGASSMCTSCLQKYKLTDQTMQTDPVHELEQQAKPSPVNKSIEQNSETGVLQARITAFDESERESEEAIVLEPVSGEESAKPDLPMLKTRRQKGMLGFVQSVFHMF
jgi:hypothetical protein